MEGVPFYAMEGRMIYVVSIRIGMGKHIKIGELEKVGFSDLRVAPLLNGSNSLKGTIQ